MSWTVKQLTVLFSQASELSSETTSYEEQEQELMMVCVEELCKCCLIVSVNGDGLTVTQKQVLKDLVSFSNGQ